MARVKTNPILLISSLDPTCQSGLIRDAIVLNQLGKTTLAVCAAVANQNDVEIDNLTTLSFEEIKRQLDAIGRRYWLDWTVISGIQDFNLVASIIRYLEQNRPGIQILWKPELQHSDRSYGECLDRYEQDLFEILCKKVHTVLLNQRDLILFKLSTSLQEQLFEWSNDCNIYVNSDPTLMDSLYHKGNWIKQNHNLSPAQEVLFLSTLSAYLYDGYEMIDACMQSFLFLSDNSIN